MGGRDIILFAILVQGEQYPEFSKVAKMETLTSSKKKKKDQVVVGHLSVFRVFWANRLPLATC